MTPLPADIVSVVDAIVGAASDEARIAAVAAALDDIGVTVSGDAGAVPKAAAGLVLAPEEVELMAAESADRDAHRATLFEFAVAFGGMALLPPNDGLAADLPDNWLDVAPEASDVQINLVTTALPDLMATTISGWVSTAIENHSASDPDLVMLTTAPLLLAELARRRPTPVDLARPFAPTQVRLGWLEITILVGGLRSMLTGAEAAGIVASATQGGMFGSPSGEGQFPDPRSFADTPCDNLKQMIDSRVPLASTVIKGYVGHQIKDFIQGFINGLFGQATEFARNVGRAFKILGVLSRVQALMMFYSEARVKVELDPAFYHKPDGSKQRVGAIVHAGIDDAAWEAAKVARDLSPFATALRTCAGFLGLPVWQDTIDLGDTVKGWKVQWRLTKGGAHVEIPTRDQFESGRFERTLTPESDHSGVDAIDYDVLPEKRENHPGTEIKEPVEWCAEVFAKEPPGGVATILSAGFAGASLAGGAYLGLIAVTAKLMTGWIATVKGLDGCGQATVSYHIPLPGTWHGTITANTEFHDQASGAQTIVDGPPFGTTIITYSKDNNIDVTSTYYVSGDELEPGSGYVELSAREFTDGAMSFNQTGVWSNAWTHSGCNYDKTETWSGGTGWSHESSGSAGVSLQADGTYKIGVSSNEGVPEVEAPGTNVVAASVKTADCEDNASGSTDRPFFVPYIAGEIVDQPTGKLDPKNPGSRLVGSYTWTSPIGVVTTVSWNLTRDGGIILPTF